LPSGRQLAEQYGVAVMTVKQALGELDDLVVSWQGRGVFVRDVPIKESTSDPVRQIIGQLEALRESIQGLEQRVVKLEGDRSKRR
jgi:DNA-binding GntR family transcriptional regulator